MQCQLSWIILKEKFYKSKKRLRVTQNERKRNRETKRKKVGKKKNDKKDIKCGLDSLLQIF